MKKLALACATILAVAAGPAYAAEFANFGSTGFSYGTLTGTGFDLYTRYNAGAPQCLGYGACARGNDTYAIIAASPTPGQLLVHPGPGLGGNSAVGFTAATAGYYSLNALATSADVGGKSVGYFSIIGGVLSTFSSGSIAGTSSQSIVASRQLAAGDVFGIYVNNGDGTYFNDSTNISGSIAAVPEPATWGMMILGFGMIGFGLRRRGSNVRTSVRFA